MPALNLTPIENTRRERTPLEQIPADVKDTLEEVLTEAPGVRLQAGPMAFEDDEIVVVEGDDAEGTKDAAEAWLTHARSYAQLRPAGKFVFAGNPTKAGYIRFTATPR